MGWGNHQRSPKEVDLKLRTLVPVLAATTLLLAAAPAQAQPSAKDARKAAQKADRAVGASVDAVRGGNFASAAERIATARRLQAKAARLARRAAAGRKPARRARLLSDAAVGVDNAFDSYAELIAQAPPELQPYLLEALSRLEALRAELVAELTGFVETLPADVREQVLAAITAFQADGDLQALIAALGSEQLAAAVKAGLQELIAELTATVGTQLGELGGLEELLPPGALEQLEAAIAEIESHLEAALGHLAEVLGGTGALPEPPEIPALPTDPGALCGQLEQLLAALGMPVPPGLCEA